jgi:hypothetical protein
VIKALSIKEALLVVKRTEALPQVLDSAVLDLEQGDNAEVARLNGYLHAVVRPRAQAGQRLAATDLPFRRPGCAEARLHLAPDRPRHGAEALHARRVSRRL